MNKTYSESELKKLAQETFEKFPTAKQVFATEDGQCFLVQNRAALHAGTKGKVYPFDREDVEAKQEVVTLNAKDTIAAIVKTETLEALEAFSTDERKSVIEAYNKRKAELTVVVGVEPVQPETKE